MSTRALSDDGGRYRWVIFGVTAAPWLVFLAGSSLGEIAPLVALSFLLGTPHVMATVGLYLQPDLQPHLRAHRLRYVVAPIGLVAASGLAFGLASASVGQGLLRAFIVWQLHHFTKQNLGMFSFWCRASSRAGPSTVERRLILATTTVGVLGLVLTEEVRPQWHDQVRLVGIVLVVAGLVVAAVLGRSDRVRTMALAVPVLFYAPLCVFGPGFLFAAAAYQAAHGAQYYLMVGTVVGGDRRIGGLTVLAVLGGGAALVASATQFGYGNQAWILGMAKGVVGAHFIADAGLWRLRDPQIRAVMTDRFGFLRGPVPAPQVATAG